MLYMQFIHTFIYTLFAAILSIHYQPFSCFSKISCTKPFHRVALRVQLVLIMFIMKPFSRQFITLLCVSGALIMASICSPVPAKAYGQIRSLHLHRIGSKALLQLLPCGEATVSTMVLCHRNQTMLEELKVNQCSCGENVLFLQFFKVD